MKAMCEEHHCEHHPTHHKNKGLMPVECFEPHFRQVRPGLIGEVGRDGKVECWCRNSKIHGLACVQCYPDIIRITVPRGDPNATTNDQIR